MIAHIRLLIFDYALLLLVDGIKRIFARVQLTSWWSNLSSLWEWREGPLPTYSRLCTWYAQIGAKIVCGHPHLPDLAFFRWFIGCLPAISTEVDFGCHWQLSLDFGHYLLIYRLFQILFRLWINRLPRLVWCMCLAVRKHRVQCYGIARGNCFQR